MLHRPIARYCAAMLVAGLSFPAGNFADLPSESTLPGQLPVAKVALPAESALPPGFSIARAAGDDLPRLPPQKVPPVPAQKVAPLPPDRGPAPPEPEPPAPASNLPGESVLPPTAEIPPSNEPGQPGQDTAADDILRLGQSADAIAWLRLEMQGHTGPVRALAFTGDSARLCSAGEDKAVLVWTRGMPPHRWRHERSIFWQIQRSSRGRVYAIAARGNLIAMGGHGAMGGLGEILLVDAATGTLQAALVDERIGHRQVIVSLAFSPDPQMPGLASIDRAGKVLYWRPDPQTGLWKPREIQPSDTESYGPATARRLAATRGLAPLVMVDGNHLVLPVYAADPRRPDIITWQLQQIDVTHGEKRLWPGQQSIFHVPMVTALAASADGAKLTSADATGRLYQWDVRGVVATDRFDRACIALAYSGDGNTLVAGTAQSRAGEPARVQVWDVTDPARRQKRRADVPSAHDVYACDISPDGAYLAFASGNEVIVRSVQGEDESRLKAAVQPPLRVAFAKDRPFYRIAFGRQSDKGQVALEQSFDTANPQLAAVGRGSENDWIASTWYQSGWDVQVRRDPQRGVESFRLTEGGAERASIPLDPSSHGAPSAWCWIPTREGAPFAVAIGTRGNNNIYVYRLADKGTCPILRVFRGHAGRVNSLGISRDLRYLVSGSTDATIRVWPLAGLHGDDELTNRWGAGFAIRDQELSVVSIREDGPLYFRGIRKGDVIRRLRWAETDLEAANQPSESADPATMLRVLGQSPWDALLAFDYTRGRLPQRSFQMVPAWQQVVSLVVADNRQWAYWTPAGYYDASFEGHKLFGWQVNRGLEVLPDFFLAAQLRAALERPEVMGKLLDAGHIDGAFRLGQAAVPANAQRALADAYRLKPEIEILQPQPGDVGARDTVHVQAAVSIRSGQQLAPPKAFANGVVAINGRLVAAESLPGGQRLTYEWDAPLPSQRQVLLQVVASTEAEIAATQTVMLTRSVLPPRRAPRLFVVTAGINQYLDSQLPRLDFAVNNANSVAAALNNRASPLYDTQAISLSNQNVTRSTWAATLQQYADELRGHAAPDDLLLIFLSGHGLRDPGADKYYYLAANARYADVMGQRYGDCLSMEDFAFFAEIPCRKLVILDTCHSGALQPLRQRELKAAVRALQNDLVFTLTATEGGQEAVEERQRKLGRFTSRLVEALDGAADRQGGDGNGTVSWREIVDYVRQMVTTDSVGDEFQQYPTAGPTELLGVADFPLTTTDTSAHVGSDWTAKPQLVRN